MADGTCTAAAQTRLASSADDSGGKLVIGILMGLYGSVAINTGQNLQAQAKDAKAAAFWGRLGVWLFASGAVINFVAFGFAPTSVLSPLEGSQFVANFIFNIAVRDKELFEQDNTSLQIKGFFWRWPRKPMFFRTVLGTGVVVAGVVLPVLASSGNVYEYDEQALWCMWRQPLWIAFLYSLAAVGGIAAVGWFWVRGEPKENAPLSKNRVAQLLFSVMAASLGAYGVAEAKLIAEVIAVHKVGLPWDSPDAYGSLLTSGLFWHTLFGVVVGFSGWLFLIDLAIRIYAQISIIPLLQGFYIVFSGTAGSILMEDFRSFNTSSHILYWSGITLLFAGLLLIVPPDSDASTHGSPPPGPSAQPAQPPEPANLTMRWGAGLVPVLVSAPNEPHVPPSPFHARVSVQCNLPLIRI